MEISKIIVTWTPILILVSTWLIQYNMFKLESNKFKYNMFNRRIIIYRKIKEFIYLVSSKAGHLDSELHQLDNFLKDIKDARLLFENDERILKLCDELYLKGLKYKGINDAINRDNKPTNEQLFKNREKELAELSTWFSNQYNNTDMLLEEYLIIKQFNFKRTSSWIWSRIKKCSCFNNTK